MVRLKFARLVSFSSEDPLCPASSLVSGGPGGKWRCREPGEKQAWVLLQLQQLSTITGIDIGNNGAALVEIQVGRQGSNSDDMKVLLVASSFMSVNEARVGESTGRVRMFGLDKLSKEVSKEKWDLVKIIATQPFTSQTKYGVSFVVLSGPGAEPPPSLVEAENGRAGTALGAFKLKPEPESSIAPGSYFARQRAASGERTGPGTSVAATLRADRTLAEMAVNKESSAGKNVPKNQTVDKPPEQEMKPFKVKNSDIRDKKRKLEMSPAVLDEVKKRKIRRDNFPSRNILPGESDHDQPTSSRSVEAKKNTNKEICNGTIKTKLPKQNVYQSKVGKFSEFMKDVTFTISGFQNPLRGEIRKKGLEMGARYRGDWDDSCTHLICAFANTPKFNQVKGKGRIVMKDWIEECYSQRKRLPWRRFCLDKADKQEESEEEVIEDTKKDSLTDKEIDCARKMEMKKTEKSASKNKANASDFLENNVDMYDCDTDEEIDRLMKNEKADKKVEPVVSTNTDAYNLDADTDDEESKEIKVEVDPSEIETDPYEIETDIDDEEVESLRSKTEDISFEALSDHFRGQNFFLHGNFKSCERELLERYIKAALGSIIMYMEAKVDIIITHGVKECEVRDAKKVNKDAVFISPEWLFKCQDEEKLVDFRDYLVLK